jgi:hypothetical protein
MPASWEANSYDDPKLYPRAVEIHHHGTFAGEAWRLHVQLHNGRAKSAARSMPTLVNVGLVGLVAPVGT